MTTKQALKALYKSRDYYTDMRNEAHKEGNTEEEVFAQTTLESILRAIDYYEHKRR